MRRLSLFLGLALALPASAQALDCMATLGGVCQDIGGYVRPADIPTAATQTPPATALDGAQGASSQYARADHTHAARVQRTVLTTLADGTATWTFARPIAVPTGKLPPIAYMVQDSGTPVVVQIVGRGVTGDGVTDTHTSVSIKAQRSQLLPATLATLLPLVSFNVFGGVASGIQVNLWAADPTQ